MNLRLLACFYTSHYLLSETLTKVLIINNGLYLVCFSLGGGVFRSLIITSCNCLTDTKLKTIPVENGSHLFSADPPPLLLLLLQETLCGRRSPVGVSTSTTVMALSRRARATSADRDSGSGSSPRALSSPSQNGTLPTGRRTTLRINGVTHDVSMETRV